jgi:hypothetical protein
VVFGTACRDVEGRTLAALGAGGPATVQFAPALDVPGGAVLCALPALLANGLLRFIDQRFVQPPGYYPLPSLVLLFAFLALARVKSLERIRYQSPGEWGALLGLDRIPEVKTLREKLDAIADPTATAAWTTDLSRFWMEADETLAGVLYVDGHVRTYTGSQTVLPRRFSSRDRLCMRSLIDYWVNDREGTPFFVVTAMGNEGMLHYLKTTIVPRLLQEVSGQPDVAELAADPARHRFIMVFDREGWSPSFFRELWTTHRIAILTYQRGAYEPWPASDFQEMEVQGIHGTRTAMRLAEKPYAARDETAEMRAAVPMREIRRLCDGSDHQTSIITTVQQGFIEKLAAHMFARWSQENFFKYAERELAIDRLAGYATASAPEQQTVKNPAYVALDGDIRRGRARLTSVQAQRGRVVLASGDTQAVAEHIERCTPLDQEIAEIEATLHRLRTQRRKTPKRLALKEIPEADRPRFIAPVRTQFLNTIRITAYRAETAMVNILRKHLGRSDDGRALLQDLFTHDADLLPDPKAGTLTVRLHHFTNPQASRAVHDMLEELNATETNYPGTGLTMRFELVSALIPTGQEV